MEHFIESVRRYPCLWNTTAIEYRDQELKDAAWAEVRRDTDMASVKEAKLKWKKLRDSYRDALKRQSECAAAAHTPAGKKPYPWKYMAPMHFLQPHMSVRKKQHGSPPPHPPASNPAPPPHHPQPHHAPPPLAAHNGLANGAGERSSSSSSSEAESSPKRRSAERLSAIDRKLDFLCRAHLGPGKRSWPAAPGPGAAPGPSAAPAPGPDPLDTFFSGMCQSTKRFPYPAQLRIKRTLFDAVLCAEEALVAEQQSYAALWARAASSSSSEAADGDEAGAGAGAEAGPGAGAGAEADGDADTDDQKPS